MATLKINDALQKRLNKILEESGGVLKVGFLPGIKYPDGTSIAQVAFWNEFGTTTIPARPFFRNVIEQKSGKWGNALAVNMIANGNNAKKALALVGTGIKEQITNSIENLKEPPNADSTVAGKGFDDPLNHTGLMKKSVDYEVAE